MIFFASPVSFAFGLEALYDIRFTTMIISLPRISLSSFLLFRPTHTVLVLESHRDISYVYVL